jgi:hypothetical protein
VSPSWQGSYKSDESRWRSARSTTTKERIRASDIPEGIRYDKYDHWPILADTKNAQRCKMDGCKWKTMFMCSKCNIKLCVTKSTCFVNFHGKWIL